MSTMEKSVEESTPAASKSSIYWLCRGVFIETLRRRELSVVLLFMGLFVIGALTARFVGSETHAAAAFILNLGISLAWILAMVLAILLAARQFPDELETRALYPLLAKPVARYEYVVGKWLATTLACGGTVIVLNGIALLASPWPEGLHAVMLIQALLLEMVAVATVAALTVMFSIRLPKSLTIIITGLLVFGAATVISLMLSRVAPGPMRAGVQWALGYVPNISRLDLLNAFSAGAPPISMADFVARVIYGLAITAFALGIGTALLERRSL